LEKNELENIVNEELNCYKKHMLQCVHENSIFTYLKHLAEKYSVNEQRVIEKNLDIFNWYMRKNNVDKYQSKLMALYKTHEQIMKECIK